MWPGLVAWVGADPPCFISYGYDLLHARLWAACALLHADSLADVYAPADGRLRPVAVWEAGSGLVLVDTRVVGKLWAGEPKVGATPTSCFACLI